MSKGTSGIHQYTIFVCCNKGCELLQAWRAPFLRDYPEGEINKDEFVTLCSDVLPSIGCLDSFSQVIFLAFDTDSSGGIDFEELMVGLHITSDGTTEERCDWAFQMYSGGEEREVEFADMKRSVQDCSHFSPIEWDKKFWIHFIYWIKKD